MRGRINRILDDASSAHFTLQAFVDVAVEGLNWASEATRVHRLMADGNVFESSAHALELHRKRAAAAEVFAKSQRPLGFPFLWQISIVRLWTLLEVAVEDVVCEFLSTPELLPIDSVVRRLEAPVFAFQSLDAKDRADTLLQLLKDKTRSVLKPGVGRLEGLLEPVGIGGAVPEQVRILILELSQVRHLIVHRNAVVDRRFLAKCPWVACEFGKLLPISYDHLRLYGLAVDWYNLEVDRRVDRVLGEPPHEEAIALQQLLEGSIAQHRSM
jgi:hypothetical protein